MNSPFEALVDFLREDNDSAWSWHCTVASCYSDEGATHQQANQAAARFMSVTFGIDVTEFDQWAVFPWTKVNTNYKEFKVYDNRDSSRFGVCHAYNTHYDIFWDDGGESKDIIDLSFAGITKLDDEKISLKLIGGPFDGLNYRLESEAQDIPSTIIFTDPDDVKKSSNYQIGFTISGTYSGDKHVIYRFEDGSTVSHLQRIMKEMKLCQSTQE